ncbi:hypothetical protein BY458DRAFT_497563 [Sporodiniella umbellata]|nr:hypothetical protein BY458DRAFT_497563 [Sporodiniella umbellata]
MFTDYKTSMPALGHSPMISTPYLDVDTPFTPPFFDVEPDFSPYLAFAAFGQTPILKQDVCISNYLQQGATAEFNGDPSELLIDKSKTPQWPSYGIELTNEQDEGLFPPLDTQWSNEGSTKETPDEVMELLPNELDIESAQEEADEDYKPVTSPAPRGKRTKRAEKPKRVEQASRVEKPKRGKRVEGKLHQCPYCDHVSKRRYNLSTHIKTHDKQRVKEFECSECQSRFDRRHDRDRHLATVHRGKRAIICPCCSIQFSRRDALNRHLAQRHEQENDD